MTLLLKFYPFFEVSVSGECRKLHSEDKLGSYFSPNAIRLIKIKRTEMHVWGRENVDKGSY
jgi:hypothetical protein